jgi:hypothetical protein
VTGVQTCALPICVAGENGEDDDADEDEEEDGDEEDNDDNEKRNFWALNNDTNKFYNVSAIKIGEGKYCTVWIERAQKTKANSAKGAEIAAKYDDVICKLLNDNFGEMYLNFSNNGGSAIKAGKLVLFLLDIEDGYTPGVSNGYIGGYFFDIDFFPQSMLDASGYASYKSNEAAMLYLDVYPTEVGSTAFYSTIAHEGQHIINFSTSMKKATNGTYPGTDIWLNEGLSSAAEYLYGITEGNADPNERLAYYNYYSKTIKLGNNFYVWDNRGDVLADYSTAYMFFQWLRLQASNGTGIYKDIIAGSNGDYNDVLKAANTRIGAASSWNWTTLLGSWMLANALNEPSPSIYGYKGDALFGTYNPLKKTGLNTASRVASNSVNLYAGEGVFSIAGGGGLKVNAAGNINYMAKKIGSDVSSGSGTYDAGTRVVTYNFNTDYESTSSEEGTTVAASIAPSPFGALMSLSGAEEEPHAFMIDRITDGFGKGAFKR